MTKSENKNMKTKKPQKGTWTLIAPDGRKWQADSPIKVVVLEQRERIPAKIAIERVLTAINEIEDA